MPTLLLPPHHYLNDGYGIRSWLLTPDHKRIALLYLAAVTFFFVVGGAFAALIRLDLLTPAGDLVSAETYNKLFTMHGMMMVFFFLIPSIPVGARQFSGADDDRGERPRLSEAQSGELVHLHARRAVHAVRAGHRRRRHRLDVLYAVQHVSSNTHVIPTALGIFITGFSSILTGLNFIVTIHKMRAPGLTWFRLPLFIWSHLRNEPHHRAGHTGPGHHDSAGGARARVPRRHSSIRPSAAIRCCSSTCSGSTRIRRSTS